MFMKCDICTGIFKLTKIMTQRYIDKENLLLYCPYCNSNSVHQVTDVVHSQRGYIK